jgi:hypothetical protein
MDHQEHRNHHRSWFWGTFLAKLNPQATGRSVLIKAVVGGIAGPLSLIGASYFAEAGVGAGARTKGPILLLGLIGAFIGAVLEWQGPLHNDDEEC